LSESAWVLDVSNSRAYEGEEIVPRSFIDIQFSEVLLRADKIWILPKEQVSTHFFDVLERGVTRAVEILYYLLAANFNLFHG